MSFYETGSAPTKNADAMAKVMNALKAEAIVVTADAEDASPSKKEKKSKKRKSEAMQIDEVAAEVQEEGKKIKKKKSKKDLADTVRLIAFVYFDCLIISYSTGQQSLRYPCCTPFRRFL